MGLLEDIASILNNSKTVPELPLVTSIADTDYLIFYDISEGKVTRILKSNSKDQVNLSDVYLGTVTTAGITTTETEITNYINAQGFVINPGELKVIKVNVYVNGVLYTKLYYLRGNSTGTYGTGNTVLTFSDLFEFESVIVSANSATTTVIAEGDLGSTDLWDHINATNEPSYDLQNDVIYVFTATIDSVDYSFLYVGPQPQLIGLGNNSVSESDFIQLSPEDENLSQTAPIPITYATLAALVAGQGNQLTNYIYEVTDASGFTGITSGRAWVKYSGTSAGSETDYLVVAKEEGGGTVTSVAVSGGDGIEVDSGSPITTSGTIALGINAATLKTHLNYSEEEINGISSENTTITGAHNIDASALSHFRYTLTGNASGTVTNTPSSGETIVLTGVVNSSTTQSYAITNATKTYGSYVADGSDNFITIVMSNNATSGLEVHVFYSQGT